MDLGQGIKNVEPGKFGKKNKRRALYTHLLVVNNHLNDLYVLSNKALGPEKEFKINKHRAYIYTGV